MIWFLEKKDLVVRWDSKGTKDILPFISVLWFYDVNSSNLRPKMSNIFTEISWNIQFYMRQSPILVWHNGVFIFLHFGFKFDLYHNLWGYIAIFQQSHYLCKCYERRTCLFWKKFLHLWVIALLILQGVVDFDDDSNVPDSKCDSDENLDL